MTTHVRETKTEPKVKAATAASASTAFVLWVLGTYVFQSDVPQPVSGLVAVIVPALVTFVAGYVAPVANRSDRA